MSLSSQISKIDANEERIIAYTVHSIDIVAIILGIEMKFEQAVRLKMLSSMPLY